MLGKIKKMYGMKLIKWVSIAKGKVKGTKGEKKNKSLFSRIRKVKNIWLL
jgi:hypothetical protein